MPTMTDSQRNHVGLGISPTDNMVLPSSAEKASIEYFWVGIEVVQFRNIREHKIKGMSTDKVNLVFPDDPEDWSQPTYMVLQRVVTMPPLGESLFLNAWTAQRLLEQMPKGCLLTAAESGAAVAKYLKEQIEDNVPLPEITKGAFALQKTKRGESVEELLENLDDDAILQIIEERGLSTNKAPDKVVDGKPKK